MSASLNAFQSNNPPPVQPFFARRKIVFLSASFCCLLWGSAYPAIKNGYLMLGIARADIPAQLGAMSKKADKSCCNPYAARF